MAVEENDSNFGVRGDTQKEEWARVIARAWKDSSFMSRLRQDPKGTLEDPQVREELNLNNIRGSSPGGYLPIPDVPSGLEELEQEKLEQFIEENVGLFGLMTWCCV